MPTPISAIAPPRRWQRAAPTSSNGCLALAAAFFRQFIPQPRRLPAAGEVMLGNRLPQAHVFEQRILRREIVLRRVAKQFTRVADVEPLEGIVAEAVEDRELQPLVVNAARDELREVAPGHEGVKS